MRRILALGLITLIMTVMLGCGGTVTLTPTPTPLSTSAPTTTATPVPATPTPTPTPKATPVPATPTPTPTPEPPTPSPTTAATTPLPTTEAAVELTQEVQAKLEEAARLWLVANETGLVQAMLEEAMEKLPAPVRDALDLAGDIAPDHVAVMALPPDTVMVFLVKIVEKELPLVGTQSFHITGDVALRFEDYSVVEHTLEAVDVEKVD